MRSQEEGKRLRRCIEASFDYMHAHSEQEKEEEKGMPTIVAKDNKMKMLMAKAAPSKGVHEYAVEVVRRFVERLGCNKVVL